QVKQLIEQTARSRGGWSREYGWGVVQPAAALRQASSLIPQPPAPQPVAAPWKRFPAPAPSVDVVRRQRLQLAAELTGLGAAAYGISLMFVGVYSRELSPSLRAVYYRGHSQRLERALWFLTSAIETLLALRLGFRLLDVSSPPPVHLLNQVTDPLVGMFDLGIF